MKTRRRSTPALPDEVLASALRAQPEGVFIARTRGRTGQLELVFANAHFCKMTGHPATELVGKGLRFFHAGNPDASRIAAWARTGAKREPHTGEGFLTRKDGAMIHAVWIFSVIPGGAARSTHIVATYRDTTEKRRMHEALMHAQRLDAVGRLAGGVAHDFNNLLSVINGYSQILAAKVAGQPKALKEVEEIHLAGQKAAALTRQLLAFGRRQPLKVRVVDLNRFLEANANILARLLGGVGRLSLKLDPTIGRVRVDPAQFQQVILNLILNARDALKAGGRVSIATSRRRIQSALNRRLTDARPGNYVCVTVRDNGYGMSEETQKKLFEPFFTTKPEGKGIGLGLSLVHGVVQQSGGFITVNSTPRKGSTFEIFLPETQELEEERTRGGIEPLPSTRGHEAVLLVESDEVVRKMVTGILTADGYRVTTASSVEEALRKLKGGPVNPQLLIANHSTEIDELARQLHALEKNLRVLSTSNRPIAGAFAWLQRARRRHLPKPYALSQLLKAARALLDG